MSFKQRARRLSSSIKIKIVGVVKPDATLYYQTDDLSNIKNHVTKNVPVNGMGIGLESIEMINLIQRHMSTASNGTTTYNEFDSLEVISLDTSYDGYSYIAPDHIEADSFGTQLNDSEAYGRMVVSLSCGHFFQGVAFCAYVSDNFLERMGKEINVCDVKCPLKSCGHIIDKTCTVRYAIVLKLILGQNFNSAFFTNNDPIMAKLLATFFPKDRINTLLGFDEEPIVATLMEAGNSVMDKHWLNVLLDNPDYDVDYNRCGKYNRHYAPIFCALALCSTASFDILEKMLDRCENINNLYFAPCFGQIKIAPLLFVTLLCQGHETYLPTLQLLLDRPTLDFSATVASFENKTCTIDNFIIGNSTLEKEFAKRDKRFKPSTVGISANSFMCSIL